MGVETYTLERFKQENWTKVDWRTVKYQSYEFPKTWCRERFGWRDWVHFGNDWFFRNEQDAIIFKLRWS